MVGIFSVYRARYARTAYGLSVCDGCVPVQETVNQLFQPTTHAARCVIYA